MNSKGNNKVSKAIGTNKQRRFGYQHRRNSVLRVRLPALFILFIVSQFTFITTQRNFIKIEVD